jgi:hypothetical protein
MAPNRCRQIVAVVFIKFVFTGWLLTCARLNTILCSVWASCQIICKNGTSNNNPETVQLHQMFELQGLDFVTS